MTTSRRRPAPGHPASPRRAAASRRRPRKREREPGPRLVRLLARLVCLGALVLVAMSVAVGVRQRLALVSLKTQTAFHSYLEERFLTRALVVRQERVYLSADEGQVRPLAREGDRVPASTPVARVARGDDGDGRVYCSAEPGVVSFKMDGLEGLVVPERLPASARELAGLMSARGRATAWRGGELVKPGEPLFRIVDNYRLLLVFRVPASFRPEGQVYRGSSVRVRLAGGSQDPGATAAETEASVQAWGARAVGDDEAVAVVALKQEMRDLLCARTVDVEVVTRAFWGIVVPRSALAQADDGGACVYLARGPGIVKHKVRVVGRFGKMVALEDVPEGAQIVLNPPGPHGVLPGAEGGP